MTEDVPEVELALTFPSELDVAFFLFVNEVLLPDAHRDDPPAASEGDRGFRFLCHSSPFSMPIRGIDGIKPCSKATSWASRGVSRMSITNPLTFSIQISGFCSARFGKDHSKSSGPRCSTFLIAAVYAAAVLSPTPNNRLMSAIFMCGF